MLLMAVRGRARSVHVLIHLLLSASLFIHVHGRALQAQDHDKEISAQAQKRSEDALLRDHADTYVEHNRARELSGHTARKSAHLLGRAPPAADDNYKAIYYASVRLGRQAIEAMGGQNPVGINDFSADDLSTSGWETYPLTLANGFPPGLNPFLKDHDLPFKERWRSTSYDALELTWSSASVNTNWQETQSTHNAKIYNALNSTAGVLISVWNSIPSVFANIDETTQQLPQLHELGDVIALSWLSVSSTHNGQPLKWWIFFDIIDPDTKNVMRRIIDFHFPKQQSALDRPPQRPAWSYSASSTDGLALLGSNVGMTVARGLARNAAHFGGTRMVSRIFMFKTQQGPWCLAFQIQNASEVTVSLAPPSSAELQSAPRPDEPVVAGPSRPPADAPPDFETDMPDDQLSPDALAVLELFDYDQYYQDESGDYEMNEDDPEATDSEMSSDTDGETDEEMRRDVYVRAQKRIEGSLDQDHEDRHVEYKHARESSGHTVRKAARLLGRAPTGLAAKQADERAYNDCYELGYDALEIMRGQKDVGKNVFTLPALHDSGWQVRFSDGRSGPQFPPGLSKFLNENKLPLEPSYVTLEISCPQAGETKHEWPGFPVGTKFQASQGVFRNALAPTDGVLVSLFNVPPTSANDYEPMRELPPLHEFSDVVGLCWLNASSQHEARPLKWWIFPHIIDRDSLSVMRHVITLRARQHPSTHPSRLPPKELAWQYSISSAEGLALMGCPLGIQVARTLARNRATFGTPKMVASIFMFRLDSPSGEWCLAFHIEDAREVVAPFRHAPVVAGPSRSSANNETLPDDEEVYQESAKRGRTYISYMTGYYFAGHNRFSLPALSDSGWLVTNQPVAHASAGLPVNLGSFLKQYGLPLVQTNTQYRVRNVTKPYVMLYASCPQAGKTKLPWPHIPVGTEFQRTKGIFENAFDTVAGVLISVQNLPPEVADAESPIQNPPPLRRFRDVIGLLWLTADADREVKPLKWWIFYDIRSPDTLSVMRRLIDQKRRVPPGGREEPWMYTLDTVQGQALMGTTEGAQVALSLARNEAAFGKRRVTSILVFRALHTRAKDEWCLAFIIKKKKAQETQALHGSLSAAQPQSAPRPDEPVVAGPSRPQADTFSGLGLDADMPDVELSPDTLAAFAAYIPDSGLMDWDGDPERLNQFGDYEPTVPGADAVGEVDPEMDVDDPEANDSGTDADADGETDEEMNDPSTDADADGETDPDYADAPGENDEEMNDSGTDADADGETDPDYADASRETDEEMDDSGTDADADGETDPDYVG